jgi:GT2 family glycosyltransferase
MEVSVIIPTFGRPAKIAACLQRLTRQTLSDFEVLLGIDGGLADPEQASGTEHAVRALWPRDRADRLVIQRRPKEGLAAVRNALLPAARGRIMLSLNDDVLPEPGLLGHHAAAHAEREGSPVAVVGASPWVVHEPDRLFDRLVRETSMVFFYDQMDDRLAAGEIGRDHDWGFRHCWGLNFSAPMALAREVGGFGVFPAKYGYEDNEFAFKLARRYGAPVLYRPEALARHDHRMEPEDYLARERKLGFAAWGFAAASPECSLAMFGRDVRSREELAYSRQFVERERAVAERLRTAFRDLANVPADAVPNREHPAGKTVMNALYQQHLLLKRWEWRSGLLEAAQREEQGEAGA